ncbi:hypothetical protein JOM56_000401 [Amanita muscaria]
MTNSSDPSSPIHQNVVPSEVGWQFVPQYYTFVNKHPNRLHCFYTKQSTFTHGTEGEDTKTCHGQQEIHQKITSIGFQDCKVFIHSVDAQSSANGGIIIQVIGEMSNRGESWRKFVQTFFLAEQPNGYFVLNDIFRFLKEETVEEEESAELEPTTKSPLIPEPTPTLAQPVPVPEDVREPTPPPPAPIPVIEEEAPTTNSTEAQAQTPEIQAPAPPTLTPEANGIRAPETENPSPAPVEKSLTPAPAPPQSLAPVAASAPLTPQTPAPVPLPAIISSSTSSSSAPPPTQPSQPPTAAPAPAAPSAPRSWASLAASNPKKWGLTVAADSRGTTEVPASVSPGPASGTQTPHNANQPPAGRPQQGGQGRSDHHGSSLAAAQSITTSHCFVKGVLGQITQPLLTNALSRFGPVKDVDIVHARMCAFIEYQTVDSARRAIIASLPHKDGGEGGLFIEVGGDVGQIRLTVETKKERGDRPPNRGRGGPPMMNGERRGAPETAGAPGHGGHGGHGGGQGGYNRRGGVGRGGRGSAPK